MKLLFSLLILSYNSYAASKFDQDPTIAVFEKDLMPESYRSCWDGKKQFLAKECQTYSEPCVLEKNFQNETKFEIAIPQINSNKRIVVSRNDGLLDDHYFLMSNSNNGPLKMDKVAAGTRVVAFSEDSNQFTIYADEVITSPREIKLIEKKPLKTFKFKADEGWLRSHLQRIDGLFMGHSIGSISGPAQTALDPKAVQEIPVIRIPEGKYIVSFSYRNDENATFTNSFEVVASDNTEETIIIKKIDFIKRDRTQYRLSESNFVLADNFNEGDSLDFQKGFSDMPQIVLAEKNIPLNSYFRLEEGELHPNDEFQKFLRDSTKDIPTHTVKVSGQCSTFFRYKEYKSYDLHIKADDKSPLLGKLQLVTDQDKENMKFTDLKTKVVTKFRPNLHNGKCGETISHFLHYVKETNGDWVNLGPGPWGEVGWAIVDKQSLYGGIVDFEWEKNEWVSFNKRDKKIFATGTRIFAGPEGDLENETIKFEVSEEEIFDEKGNLKIKVNCNKGC